MSEQRFKIVRCCNNQAFHYEDNGKKLSNEEVVDVLNEQQATINEYKENWDDMVELATKTSLRNVELDEQIGRLQRENEQLRKDKEQLKERLRECGMRLDRFNCR